MKSRISIGVLCGLFLLIGLLPALAANTVLTTAGGTTTTVSYDLTTAATALNALYNHTADGIAATQTDRIQLSNATAAAAGAQQWSPSLRFTGQGWKTTATAASQAVDWRITLTPVQGSTAPTASLLFDYAVNGGAFGTQHTFTSAGAYTAVGTIQAGNGSAGTPAFRFTTGSNSGLFWNGSGWIGFVHGGTEAMSLTSGNLLINAGWGLQTPNITVGSGASVTKILSATATLDFGSTATLTDSDLTIAVTNAALGDTVAIGVPNGSVVAGGDFSGWVSSAGVVTIRFSNHSVGSLDPASGTFRATVIKF
ncbi:MAG: hypothetical protein V4641_22600 [Pseudomonadota bacterium]